MALFQLLVEEEITEDRIDDYFGNLYRIVCVGERPSSPEDTGAVVRSTYVVDWEQLVHLLEDYSGFGEDIVEVAAVSREEARFLRGAIRTSLGIARA